MLLRAIRREIHQIAHPRSVEVVKLDGKVAESPRSTPSWSLWGVTA